MLLTIDEKKITMCPKCGALSYDSCSCLWEMPRTPENLDIDRLEENLKKEFNIET